MLTAWQGTCSSCPPRPHRAKRCACSVSAARSPSAAGLHGSAGTGRWPRPGHIPRPGTRRDGRSSQSPTSERSCSSRLGRMPPQLRPSSYSLPVPGSRPMSAQQSVRSVSSAASGWTDHGGWPGWRTMPAPQRRTRTCPRQPASPSAFGLNTSHSAIQGQTGRRCRTSTYSSRRDR